jgi:hypothetical protein
MLRLLFFASALCASVAILSCGGDSTSGSSATPGRVATPIPTVLVRVSPQPRPTDVPTAAAPIVETSTLGRITRLADQTPQTTALRTLTDAGCANGLLTIHTSLETIYAKLTCDLFSSDQFDQYFAGKQAALVLEVAPSRFRIIIDSAEGVHAEYTPKGIWVH